MTIEKKNSAAPAFAEQPAKSDNYFLRTYGPGTPEQMPFTADEWARFVLFMTAPRPDERLQ